MGAAGRAGRHRGDGCGASISLISGAWLVRNAVHSPRYLGVAGPFREWN